MSVLGSNIRKLRENRGLTQAQLGEKIGLAESTISLYEAGKREPDNATLARLADFFGVSVDYLLGRTSTTQVSPNAAPAVSPEDLALLEKLKNLSPEKRKAIEILAGDDEQAAGVGN